MDLFFRAYVLSFLCFVCLNFLFFRFGCIFGATWHFLTSLAVDTTDI